MTKPLTRRTRVTTLRRVPTALHRSTDLTSRSLLILTALFLGAAASACAGPPVPSPIDGEPVCPDFEVGATHTKHQGSLRYPVKLAIRSGSTPVMTKVMLALRTPQDPPTRILLSDSNDEYTVEWSQCENERATRPVVGGARDRKDETAHYECGTATVYSSEKLVTKKGDLGTHALHFVAPPRPECWTSDVPAAPPPSPAADTDAGAPVEAAADAGAASDAGAATDAGAVTDAGSAADAGAKADAGK